MECCCQRHSRHRLRWFRQNHLRSHHHGHRPLRQRLKALLWSEMAFVSARAGTRSEHSAALMDMLSELDVEHVDYDPDGFDERVKAVRKQFKQLRREE